MDRERLMKAFTEGITQGLVKWAMFPVSVLMLYAVGWLGWLTWAGFPELTMRQVVVIEAVITLLS